MLLTAIGKKPRSGLVAFLRPGRMHFIRTITLLIFCQLVLTNSQAQGINLTVKDAPLEMVFAKIQQLTDYRFIYTSEQLEGSKPVSFSVKNASIDAVMSLLFKDQSLGYQIEDKFIILRKEPAGPNPVSGSKIIRGIVKNEDGLPLAGITITVKGSQLATASDAGGIFQIRMDEAQGSLIFTGVNTETLELKPKGKTYLEISLKNRVSDLAGVSVTVNTGYQEIPGERATGSFSFIDRKLLNRSATTNTLDRIENLVPGVLFNKGEAFQTDPLLIRGRSTIFANAAPLIVLDNFPYDGDLSNINPNDVENISILKDAAAASIWGARAGNGVIVITTRKGKTPKPQIEFNTYFSYQERPDLMNIRTISSADYVDLEKQLYGLGYYAGNFNNPFYPPVTPVVALLNQADSGLISPAAAQAAIENFKGHDVRNDLSKYFYRPALNFQNALSISGASGNNSYYLSTGWDKNLPGLVGSSFDRITLRAQNSFRLNPVWTIEGGISYAQTITGSGNNPGYALAGLHSNQHLYPYAALADAKGNALPVYLDYGNSLIQQAKQDGLQDWTYKPLEDIPYEINRIQSSDLLANISIRSRINADFSAEAIYKYENQSVNGNDDHQSASYFTRNQVNAYSQVDPLSGNISYPVPVGGILDRSSSGLNSHHGRLQLNVNHNWNGRHQLTALAGWEIRSIVSVSSSNRIYGYDPDISNTNPYVDYVNFYKQYGLPYAMQVQNNQTLGKKTDHFLSYFANAAYTFSNRYVASASLRKDEANLFGVKTNQKGTPLWSAGVAWILDHEAFYRISWLPSLKWKLTYGYSGNISRLASAYATARIGTALTTPATVAFIQSPPNDNLRWEQVGIFNTGIEFATRNNRISGSIEYYTKSGKGLMGNAPVDPTYGLLYPGTFFGNVASMKGNGIDLALETHNLNGPFKWYSHFIFSYAASRVTKYFVPESAAGNAYLNPNSINPVLGRPVYSLYSFAWAGLDPATGDPQGIYGGKPSKDYASIYANTSLDSMVYNGPMQPVYFGAIRNTLTWKNVSLSFNISFKAGYYFRRTSVNYSTLFGSWTGSSDYAKRWKQPGDEKSTYVPSLVYPPDFMRDAFYQSAQVLVSRADHIRWEDINLSYDLDRQSVHSLPVSHIRIFLYASNLGLLWAANREGIDPYYNNVPREGRKWALGLNIRF